MEETAISTEAFQDIEPLPTNCTQILSSDPQVPGQLESKPRSASPLKHTSLPFQAFACRQGPCAHVLLLGWWCH